MTAGVANPRQGETKSCACLKRWFDSEHGFVDWQEEEFFVGKPFLEWLLG